MFRDPWLRWEFAVPVHVVHGVGDITSLEAWAASLVLEGVVACACPYGNCWYCSGAVVGPEGQGGLGIAAILWLALVFLRLSHRSVALLLILSLLFMGGGLTGGARGLILWGWAWLLVM